MNGSSTTCLLEMDGMKIMAPWCDKCGCEAWIASLRVDEGKRAEVTVYCHGERAKFECRLDGYGVATPRIGG